MRPLIFTKRHEAQVNVYGSVHTASGKNLVFVDFSEREYKFHVMARCETSFCMELNIIVENKRDDDAFQDDGFFE